MDQTITDSSTYDEVLAFVDKQLSIQDDRLDSEVMRGTRIFTDFNRIYAVHAKKLRALQIMKDKLYIQRWKRYTGKQTAAHYKEEPLSEAILKQDVDKYMAVDNQMIEMEALVSEQDRIVRLIEDSIKALKDRNWQIKSAIEFRRMIAGV